MKKLLIATTALVATAGVAAAEVKVTGDGRMGVVYNGEDLNFSSRIRVRFTASGETDSGLSFGGTFLANEAGTIGGTSAYKGNGAAEGSEGSIFISGAFGRLEMGDVLGAAQRVLGDLPEVGFTDPTANGGSSASTVGQNDILYITGDDSPTVVGDTNVANNPTALYTYTTGGLTFALSLSDGTGGPGGVDKQDYAVGVKYVFGDYSVSLGYEVSDVDGFDKWDHLIIGGDAKFGTTTVKAFYGTISDGTDDVDQYGIGVTSVFDALTVKGYVKKLDGSGTDVLSWGIGADYALGGGATLAGGLVDTDLPGTDVVADFGIKFTF